MTCLVNPIAPETMPRTASTGPLLFSAISSLPSRGCRSYPILTHTASFCKRLLARSQDSSKQRVRVPEGAPGTHPVRADGFVGVELEVSMRQAVDVGLRSRNGLCW